MTAAPPVSPANAIARRDLLEFVRDRRAVFITFLLPLIAYPIVALATVLGLRTAIEQLDGNRKPIPLAMVLSGRDAPALATRLDAVRDAPERSTLEGNAAWPASLVVTVAETAEQAVAAVASGDADAWVEVPPGTARALNTLGAVILPLQATTPSQSADLVIGHVEAVFESLADAIRKERLARLQVPEAVFDPVQLSVAERPAGTSRAQATQVASTVAGSLLMILTLLTVTGAFHPAADAFAGEKERGTIETLMVAPCGIGEVVRGKFLAVYGVTLATLLANLVAIAGTAAVGLQAVPENLQGLFAAAPSLPAVLTAVVTQVVLAAVAAAACLAITSSLRSLKEAHHALTTVMLAVSVLAAAGLVPMPVPREAVAVMPVAGQVLVARLALTGETIGLLLPLTLVAAVAWCWLLLKATSVALADEELIFRGPDAAGGLLQRPPPSVLPSPLQGVLPAIIGLAGVWYVQSVLPANLVIALPLQQLFSMVLPLAVLVAWQRVDLVKTLRLHPPRGRGWVALPGAVLVGIGLFLVGALALRWVVGSTPSAAAEELAGRLTALLTSTPSWLVVLVLAVIPAVCEELVFRGWMLSALVGEKPSRGKMFAAVVVQAALFSVVHLLPERLPTTFTMGLVLGWIALRTGSLLPGILCHAVHNAVPVTVSLVAGTSLESLEVSPWALFAGGLVVAGVGLGLVAFGRGGRGFTAFVAVLFACVMSSGPTAAAQSDTDSDAASDTFTVGVFEIETISWMEEGKPAGFSADLWSEIAKRLQVQADFVVEEHFDQTIRDVQEGTVDVLLGPLAMTEAREQVIDFTHPVMSSGMRIAVRSRPASVWSSPLLSILTWELFSVFLMVVGLLAVAAHVLWFTERLTNGEVFPRSYVAGVREAASNGEAEAVVFERHVVEHLVSRGNHPGFSVVGPVFDSFDYGMAVRQGNPLRERLNTALLALREDGTLEAIETRWFGKHE